MRALLSLVALVGTVAAASRLPTRPDYVLSPDWDIAAAPQHREFRLVVANTSGAPDGYVRPVLTVNGQFPGPANADDTLSVTVVNQLKVGLSMHWHGLHVNGTSYEDGVAGVTQCAILPNNSYTYTFSLKGQYGTYWYHSHDQGLLADGVFGPLIVHSPADPLVRGRDYRDDQVVVLADWFHNTSEVIISGLASPTGYNNNIASPGANSALFNGHGVFDCSLTEPSGRCHNVSRPEIFLRPDVRTRLRWIGGSTHAMIRASIDEHPLSIIEADGTGVKGPELHRVSVYAGQRYSTVVTTTAADAGRSFWMRGAMVTTCWAYNTTGSPTGLAAVRVLDANGTAPTGPPTTKDWPDLSITGVCVDPDRMKLEPLVRSRVPKAVAGRSYFRTEFAVQTKNGLEQYQPTPRPAIHPHFYANNHSFSPTPWRPLLFDLAERGQGYINKSAVSTITTEGSSWWEIVIVNLDSRAAHPYHLHGVNMALVYNGTGDPTPAELDALPLDLENPIRRDTISLEALQFAVVRIPLDNPGVWLLHCHIGWHLAEGKAGVVVIQPEKLRTLEIPQQARDLCDLAPPNASSISQPARRALRPREIADGDLFGTDSSNRRRLF